MASLACSLRAVARPATMHMRIAAPRPALRPFSTTRPTLLKKYTKDHEWVDLSADRKSATIGISGYAAEQLGDVVYVELPTPTGDFVEQGDAIAAVESVKSASDVNAPIRCKVTLGNLSLEDKPATINKVPEDDSNAGGWIVKVDVDEEGARQYDELMDGEAYKSFVSE